MDADEVVKLLKEEIARLRADRDAAIESERRLWRAYSQAKGAAERAAGVLGMVVSATEHGHNMEEGAIQAELDAVNSDLTAAEDLAGVAVE